MDEIVKLVTQKAGISEAQAKKAVETVIGFLKDKLPAPVASQLDGVVSGEGLGGVAKGLGGLLGKS